VQSGSTVFCALPCALAFRQDAAILENLGAMPVGFRALFIVILIGLVLGGLIILVESARSAVISQAQRNDAPRTYIAARAACPLPTARCSKDI